MKLVSQFTLRTALCASLLMGGCALADAPQAADQDASPFERSPG